MAKTLPVKDMPAPIRNACKERGHEPTYEMTAREAVGEWSAWHLGDSGWATDAVDFYEKINAAIGRAT